MIQYETTRRLADAILAKGMLNGLENYYPGFQYWYVNKCMPGIVLGPDILILAREHGQIVGLAIGKKREEEVKLRCIRVLPQYQNRGTGLHLIDHMLHALDDDKPYCTVPEEMMHQYSRAFINRYRFSLDRVDRGPYRKGVLEYGFNAPLDAMPAETPL
jgi:GNAT superfamily N-acetyltransferase